MQGNHWVSMVIDSPSDQPPGTIDAPTLSRQSGVVTSPRDFGLKIARDGRWFYRGSPIERPALVKLFASVLRREADGSYWLVTPVERGRIEVEDVPFIAVELVAEGEGEGEAQRLHLRTNLDQWMTIDAAHPLQVRDVRAASAPGGPAGPVPYVHMEHGLAARLARPVYYDLVELGLEAHGRFGVWSAGHFFLLEPTEESCGRRDV